MLVVASLELLLEVGNEIFTVFSFPPIGRFVGVKGDAVVGRASVSPELHPLYGRQASYRARETVRPGVGIAENDIGVEIVDEVLPSEIALEARRPFDGCELVLDFNDFVMHHFAIC